MGLSLGMRLDQPRRSRRNRRELTQSTVGFRLLPSARSANGEGRTADPAAKERTMRHRVSHRKLGRVTEHRISMLRNQATR